MKKRLLCMRLISLGLTFVLLASALAACTTSEFELDLGSREDLLKSSEESKTPIAEYCPVCGGYPEFDREVRILGWEEGKEDYWRDTESGNAVEQSLYNRNQAVEESLCVELLWTFIPGDYADRDAFVKHVETSSQAGNAYDATISLNTVAYLMAAKGYAANLNGTRHLDFYDPWWPSALLSETMVNDTLYVVTEGNSLRLLQNMTVMFFNNELLDKKGIESPYYLVERNEWTIDEFAKLIKDTYEDLNANGTVDQDDLFGFANATAIRKEAWFFALGYQYIEVRDGALVSLIDEEGIGSYIDKMADFYGIKDVWMQDDRGIGYQFAAESVYFYNSPIRVTQYLATKNSNLYYGIAPLPKLNPEQKRFYTYVSSSYDSWCVPYNAKDLDCSSAVLDCMASESYSRVGPAYYDTYVQSVITPDIKLATMYELARESVTFDMSRLYFSLHSFTPRQIIDPCIVEPKTYTWDAQYAAHKGQWDILFDKIVAVYSK